MVIFFLFCFRPFFASFVQRIHLSFRCYLIHLPAVYSQRLETSGYSCFLLKPRSSFKCLEIPLCLLEKSTKVNNNKLLSDCNGTRTHNHLIRKRTLNHLAKLAKWLSCVVNTYLYGAFDCMFLSCHVRVSEWIHTYSCLNVKELLARSRREIWSLSDCNWTRIHNHLVHKRTLIRTYSQMHCTDKYSQHSSIIWPVWPNGWVFVYELNGCGFESRCSHLNFGFRACFEQGVPWHSGNYRVWIHSETRTWHDKNIQSNKLLTDSILSFSNFKLLFVFSSSDTLKFWATW